MSPRVKRTPEARSRPPARTAAERENQIVGRAYDLAERQLEDGTASAQVITHFLKLGTEREKLERVKLEHETKLLQARSEAIASGKRVEELYAEALKAMRSYAGQAPTEDDYED